MAGPLDVSPDQADAGRVVAEHNPAVHVFHILAVGEPELAVGTLVIDVAVIGVAVEEVGTRETKRRTLDLDSLGQLPGKGPFAVKAGDGGKLLQLVFDCTVAGQLAHHKVLPSLGLVSEVAHPEKLLQIRALDLFDICFLVPQGNIDPFHLIAVCQLIAGVPDSNILQTVFHARDANDEILTSLRNINSGTGVELQSTIITTIVVAAFVQHSHGCIQVTNSEFPTCLHSGICHTSGSKKMVPCRYLFSKLQNSRE